MTMKCSNLTGSSLSSVQQNRIFSYWYRMLICNLQTALFHLVPPCLTTARQHFQSLQGKSHVKSLQYTRFGRIAANPAAHRFDDWRFIEYGRKYLRGLLGTARIVEMSAHAIFIHQFPAQPSGAAKKNKPGNRQSDSDQTRLFELRAAQSQK